MGLSILLVGAAGCRDHSQEPAPSFFTTEELARQEARAQNVEILRDDFGVPHIYGKTDADAVFGLLYAQSEDDFPRVERNYVWAIGRLAEVEGEDALISDLRARLYMSEAEARAAYSAAPEWLRELCVAFADGINYYLHTHPEVTPRLLERFEPWMPFYFFEGSIGGDIEQIPLDGIEAFYNPRATPPPATKVAGNTARPLSSEDFADREPRGSNGFAISGSLTRSGDAMLLINPHTSFYFRGEVHVVSEEGLNAYGAVTWGQFFVYQGFSEHNGWMHTSTYVDFIDEFLEDVTETDSGFVYRYGEETRELEAGEVTLRYKQEGEALGERTFPTFRTHHGPITHEDNGTGKWVATKINWDPVRALEQSYLRMKTENHAGFQQMMDIRTNSSNNTVYADRDGTIAYYHGNFVPRRDPAFDYQEPVDGSNPSTDWQGKHELNEVITVVNPETGWIQNANSTPFTAAGPNSPKPQDYPFYMAPDPENFRGLHAVQVLEEASDLTLDSLIELAYDEALPAFDVLLPPLIRAYRSNSPQFPQLDEPIQALQQWDRRVSADSVPMSLAHVYATKVSRTSRSSTAPTGSTATRPGQVERYRWFSEATPGTELLEILSASVDELDENFGTWQTPWGEINRFQRLPPRNTDWINSHFDDALPSLAVPMASGRWGALASFGARAYENTKRIYGSSGNSFIAVVEFGERVRAKSLLAGGQSGDPHSPHFNDQAKRYAKRQFKDVAYYREDVEARTTRRYRPGESSENP